MDRPEIPIADPRPASARSLLEQYTYDRGDVEILLRFAEEHRLAKDNLVWLLTAILKLNLNFVSKILSAAQYLEGMIRRTEGTRHENDRHAEACATRLISQIEEAASTSAGKLDLARAGLERVAGQCTTLGEKLEAAAKDHAETRAVLEKLVGAKDSDSALAVVVKQATDTVRHDAYLWLRAALAETKLETRKVPAQLYILNGVQLGVTVIVLIRYWIGS